MEAGGLFQPVAHCKAQSPVIRALCEDLRHRAVVKGPQGIEHPLGLGQFVAAGAQSVDLLLGEEMCKLIKADDARTGTHPPQNLLGGLLRRAGDDRHRCLGGVVAVLHSGSLGLLISLERRRHSLVHLGGADQPLQIFQRQSAGPQQPGRITGQVQDRGLHSHRAGTAVHYTVDLAVHILQHILGAGAAGSA